MQPTTRAASGGTGQELTRQALERGHTVTTAIARSPARIAIPDSAQLTRIAADVREPESIKAALHDSLIVPSGLGVAHGDPPGTLTAGARAVTEAHPQRVIWLGAIGTGPPAQAGGLLVRTMFRAVRHARRQGHGRHDGAPRRRHRLPRRPADQRPAQSRPPHRGAWRLPRAAVPGSGQQGDGSGAHARRSRTLSLRRRDRHPLER